MKTTQIKAKALAVITTSVMFSAGVSTSVNAAETLGESANASTEPSRIKSFTELDTNNDGRLSAEEISRGDASINFAKVDLDRDRAVNREELYRYYAR